MRRSLTSLAFALLFVPCATTFAYAAPSSAELESFEAKRRDLERQLEIVERLYMDTPDAGEQGALRKRFSDAELQFLLQNYESASVLFYDLVGNETFARMPEFTESLYMLAEALYQQQGFQGARLYFREYLGARGRRGRHFREALLRSIELSARFSDFSGIDRHIRQLQGPGGALPPEVAYAYGKWFFGRGDLPESERQRRAGELFTSVIQAGGAFVHQAHYFQGVLAVQRGDLESATSSFQALIAIAPTTPAAGLVQEQAHLALGRIFLEQGRFSEAIDRYQYIDYRSDAFVEALYEIAWAHVRRAKAEGDREDYRKALQACERLVATAPDSLIATDALVLQGHLYLLLGQFDEAGTAYRSVIDKFQPAHDDLAARLNAHHDPVEFFQTVIQNSNKTFDLELFLPKFAIPWATTEREIAEAVRITTDIDETRQAIDESFKVATLLIERLEQRRGELFPFFQKGFSQADAVDAGLMQLRRELIEFEQAALMPQAKADEARAVVERLKALRVTRSEIESELERLPQSEAEFASWRTTLNGRVRALEQATHRVGIEVESLFAIQAAIDKLLRDTKELPGDARADFTRQLTAERAVAESLRETVRQKKRAASDARVQIDLLRPDDAALRGRYARVLAEEREETRKLRALTTVGALPADALDRLHAAIDSLGKRTEEARALLGSRIDAQAAEMKRQVIQEVSQLEAFQQRSLANATGARGLIGSIAYESFRKVLSRFYDAMIKAEVGLVDIAWTRKQKFTEQIQDLSSQKDGELKELELDFREALTEAQ